MYNDSHRQQEALIGYDNTMLNMHNIIVGFNPNDFWYKNPSDNIASNLPTYADCQAMDSTNSMWDNKCDTYSKLSGTDQQGCIKRELCVNRDYAETLMQLQTKHRGSDQDYLDTKRKYNQVFIQSINLGIGILGVSYIIYTLMKNRNNV